MPKLEKTLSVNAPFLPTRKVRIEELEVGFGDTECFVNENPPEFPPDIFSIRIPPPSRKVSNWLLGTLKIASALPDGQIKRISSIVSALDNQK